MTKSYYDPKTNKIYAESKLDYYHEKYHQIIRQTTYLTQIQEMSFYLFLISLIFYNKIWQISLLGLYIGLELIEESAAWIYAYKQIKQRGKKHETNKRKTNKNK